jgi:group I intron endonuclease
MHIYKITNNINGDFYIGKTIKTPEERLQRHFYSAKYQSHTYLHRAMRKYGFENFCIEIVETNPKDLNVAEVKYISEMTPQYNMTKGGDGRSGPISEEHKRKIGNANRGENCSSETREKISKALKGRSKSKNHRKKISKTLKGQKRSPMSEETKKKIGDAMRGKNLGPMSEEHKKKISESLQRK